MVPLYSMAVCEGQRSWDTGIFVQIGKYNTAGYGLAGSASRGDGDV